MNQQPPVEIIDEENPEANMYGVLPCPRCGDRYRCPESKEFMTCNRCGYRCLWRRAGEGGTPCP